MTERSKGRLRLIVLLLAGIVVQTTVASDLRIDGVAPDLMLLLAVCAGLLGGSRQGVLVGFACGLLSDLWMTDTPVGLAALTFCLVGYGVGALRSAVLPEGWVTIPVLVFLASAVGVIGFVGIGDVVGQSQLVAGGRTVLIRIVVIESAANAVLSLPVAWLYGRAARGTEGAAELGRGRIDAGIR
jgi:rod shape-determining protein MreD